MVNAIFREEFLELCCCESGPIVTVQGIRQAVGCEHPPEDIKRHLRGSGRDKSNFQPLGVGANYSEELLSLKRARTVDMYQGLWLDCGFPSQNWCLGGCWPGDLAWLTVFHPGFHLLIYAVPPHEAAG